MKTVQIITFGAAVAVLTGCAQYRENMGYAKQVEMNQLPVAAQKTIEQEVGNRQIARIDQGTKESQPAYRVEVEETGLNPTLWVSSSGAILKESDRLASRREVNEAAGAERNVNEPAGADRTINEPAGAQAPNPMNNGRTDPDYQ